MDLIFYISRFCLVLKERKYFLKFSIASCLETRRVVENELWVILEGELVINIMDPSLRHQSQRPYQRNGEDGTFDVGLICQCRRE